MSVQRFEIADPTHGNVPCTLLCPVSARAPRALCLFLYGGGGSCETLDVIAPAIERAWAEARLPELAIATPDVGPFSFYLDDPARGLAWESFIAQRFVPQVSLRVRAPRVGLLGVSMGGYGALKLAFAQPEAYGAVAAISPMIEPSCEAEPVRARNRWFYPPEVPQALLGRERDAALYARDQPVARARARADALRACELPIYIDAAGNDLFGAHDGAEYLHRWLWQLDIAHEYHLRRDSDHSGPDMLARIESALVWVAERLQPSAAAPLDPLRAQLEEPRRAAAALDPSMARRYGLL